MKNTLVSFIVPSRRPAQLSGLFDSIENNTVDYDSVEVLVKIDDDRGDIYEFLLEEVKARPFTIRFISTPRLGGQFTLWVAYEELLEMVANSTYFISMLTDEARFDTYGWDERLKKYIGFFPDDVFRLRISQSRYVNNVDLFSCAYLPECFAIFTKKWLDLVEGFGDSYAPDTHHQMIAYHLAAGMSGIGSSYHLGGIYRDIQIHDIKFSGFDWGHDVTQDQFLAHELRMIWEWERLISIKTQKQISYYSRRIMAYIWAHKNSIKCFSINGGYKAVQVVNKDGDILKVFYANFHTQKILIKNYDAYLFLLKRKLLITAKYIFGNYLKKSIKIDIKYKYLRKIAQFLIKIYKKGNFNSGSINNENFFDSFPQGLDRGRPWFNLLYKKTGYIVPDPDTIDIEYKNIRSLRKARREKVWNLD